ncbi:MAG: PIN domain-containing protein [Candidatus Sumerlaeota bacterium]|nr:PIN domain-containing protein [Candidatus Sumerlaeota bacterium]
MKAIIIDANVLIRYLVEDPQVVAPEFKGVFDFFPKVERGEIAIHLPELVVFEAHHVLRSFYKVPSTESAKKLAEIVGFDGVQMNDKQMMLDCLRILQSENIGLVDAYILAYCHAKNEKDAYSFDKDLSKRGLNLLEVD